MKRRDFIVATAGMAGAMRPLLSRGAVPCAPGSLAVNGQPPITTACLTGGSYSTNFDGTENPISEGGQWAQQGKVTGIDYSNMRSANGLAYGTQVGDGARGYDDSMALLGGTWAANQRVTAAVSYTGSRSSSTSTHELLLLLRGTIAAHSIVFYVATWGYSGANGTGSYMQLGRVTGEWYDSNTLDIYNYVSAVPDPKNGDVFKFQVVGNQFEIRVNNVLIGTGTDSFIANGAPGMGAFWRGTENASDFAFTNLTAESI